MTSRPGFTPGRPPAGPTTGTASVAHGGIHHWRRNPACRIVVNIAGQILLLKAGAATIKEYLVSTGRNGAGEVANTGCTPRGRHRIAEMIGAGCVVNTVFVHGRPTGEVYTPALGRRYPERNWILTRIMVLRGDEPGVNQGGIVDTYNRCVYIHGAPADVTMGKPGSAGCIRMRNRDAVELFDRMAVGCEVELF